MSDKLEIPRLKVKKDWHVGLHPDPVDRSHPDVHDEQLIQDAVTDLLSRKFVSLSFNFDIYANSFLKIINVQFVIA